MIGQFRSVGKVRSCSVRFVGYVDVVNNSKVKLVGGSNCFVLDVPVRSLCSGMEDFSGTI